MYDESQSYHEKEKQATRRMIKIIALIVVLSLVVIGGCSAGISAYSPVDAGKVAAVTRFGGTTGEVFYPGLNWKAPYVEGAITLPTQPRVYETSSNPDTSGADFTDFPVNSQTADGQEITIKYSVVFHVPEETENIVSLAEEYRTMSAIVERLIKAQSRSIVRNFAKLYTAEQLFGSNDPNGVDVFDYQQAVFDAMYDKIEELGYGVVLDDFLVRKIDFDPEYVAVIEQQQIAQEQIKTADFQAQQAIHEAKRIAALAQGEADAKVVNATADAEVKVINANAEAERVIISATADAESVRLRADAEADAKEAVGKMLARYPETIQLEFIQNLSAVDWGIMPFDNITPLFPLNIPGE